MGIDWTIHSWLTPTELKKLWDQHSHLGTNLPDRLLVQLAEQSRTNRQVCGQNRRPDYAPRVHFSRFTVGPEGGFHLSFARNPFTVSSG